MSSIYMLHVPVAFRLLIYRDATSNVPFVFCIISRVYLQLFQVLASNFLLTDPDSLLSSMAKEQAANAASAGPDSGSDGDDHEYIYVDRDWWLFRYIMIFLRDQVLPDNRQLLAQVYTTIHTCIYLMLVSIYYRIFIICIYMISCTRRRVSGSFGACRPA